MFLVAWNTLDSEMSPVWLMYRVFPLFPKEAPFPLVKENPDRTPLVSKTLVSFPVRVITGALPLYTLVKLGMRLADRMPASRLL